MGDSKKDKKGKIVEFDCMVERSVFKSENWSNYAVSIVENDSQSIFDSIEGIDKSEKGKSAKVKHNKYGNVSIVGMLPELDLGVKYTMVGEEINDDKYGWQYNIISHYRDRPKTVGDTRDFLANILTPKQADVLLGEYPDIVQMIIDGEESKINPAILHGFRESTLSKVIQKIQANFIYFEIVLEFSPFGLSLSAIIKMHRKYGSIEKVREKFNKDPYKFLMSLDGVGFHRADTLILNMKPELIDSFIRCKGYMHMAIMEKEKEGHTVISKRELHKNVSSIIPESADYFDEVLSDKSFKVIKDIVTRKETFDKELFIAKTLTDLNSRQEQRVWEYDVESVNRSRELPYTDEQLRAIKYTLDHNVCMLFSGGGTGKSYTMKLLSDILDEIDKTAIWLAPTGRASLYLGNYIEKSASTIHRGLEFKPIVGWGKNETNKLKVDIVIVDESSMIDLDLMYRLLKAIDTKQTKLLFVGDDYQIPSVGKGNVSYDMIKSNLIHISRLTKVFRYAEGGMFNVIDSIRFGKVFFDKNKLKDGVNIFGKERDYVMFKTEQENSIKSIIKIYDALVRKKDVDILDIAIITSKNVGDYGTLAINRNIQNYLLKKTDKLKISKSYTVGKVTYYVGDLVLETKNRYDMKQRDNLGDFDGKVVEVFNGMTGRVIDIDVNKGDMIISFNDVRVFYTRKDIDKLLLAYAVSTFKMQGGSADNIILSTPQAHTFMLNKNLLYTGASRAKKKLYHVTDLKVLYSALKKSAVLSRDTLLAILLRKTQAKWVETGSKVNPYIPKKIVANNDVFNEKKPELDSNGFYEASDNISTSVPTRTRYETPIMEITDKESIPDKFRVADTVDDRFQAFGNNIMNDDDIPF